MQRAHEAIRPPAQARPGWQVLSELRADIGRHPAPADASAVFTELAASHAPFRHLSYAAIGMLGLPLDTSAQPAAAS